MVSVGARKKEKKREKKKRKKKSEIGNWKNEGKLRTGSEPSGDRSKTLLGFQDPYQIQ